MSYRMERHYTVVKSNNSEELAKLVNDLLEQGWRLQGGVAMCQRKVAGWHHESVTGSWVTNAFPAPDMLEMLYAQAMVKFTPGGEV